VTDTDLAALIAQYRAGLGAEITLLYRLEALADYQKAASEAGDLDALQRATDEREQTMSSLIGIEQELAVVRHTLSRAQDEARHLPGFEEAVELHRSAAALATRILSTDDESLRALASAEISRRETARALDHGEATLAAYRRALTPASGANLISRRG
jgi:hypothetical protein